MSTPLAVTVCVWGRGEEDAGHVCIGEEMHVPLGLKRVQFVLPCVVTGVLSLCECALCAFLHI